jgi:signal transduction histidine kinase
MIHVKASDQLIELLIRDNGKGFDRTTGRVGNGLQNMEQRAKALGADLNIDSIPGKGTSVKLLMKMS